MHLAHLTRGSRIDLRGIHQRLVVPLASGQIGVVNELHASEIRAISRFERWLGNSQAYAMRHHLTTVVRQQQQQKA